MKILINILLLIGVTFFCYIFIPPGKWVSAGETLVIPLSLIAGALLMRLMRAFPVTDPNGFMEESEIEILRDTVLKACTYLRNAAGVAIFIILLFVVGKMIEENTYCQSIYLYVGKGYSVLIGLSILLLLKEMFYAIKIDFSIMKLQADSVSIAYKKKLTAEQERVRRENSDIKYSFKDEAPYPGRKK